MYTEEILAEDIAQIYIKEVFIKYRVLDKIILNRDPRFISAFWEVFLVEVSATSCTPPPNARFNPTKIYQNTPF